MKELNQVISDSSIPYGPDNKTNSDIGYISAARSTVPGIYYQEVVLINAYVNMKLGLLQGSDNRLMKAVVKQVRTKNEGLLIGTEHSNPLIDTR